MGGAISKDAWRKIVDSPLTLISMMGQEGYYNLVCLYRQPKITLWPTTSYRRCDIPRCMTKNRWRSVDTQFHNGTRRVLLSVWPIKAGKNTFMTEYDLSGVWYPRTHDQSSLMLRWRSCSWRGIERIALRFAFKGSQKSLHDLLQPIGGVISPDAWPKIIVALLTLICMMGQGVYCNLFCL